MCLLQVADCKQPSALTKESHTCSKSITFLGIHKSRLGCVGGTGAYQQLKLFFFLKYSLDEIFRGTEYCTRNWLKICSQKTKTLPFDKMERSHSHGFTKMENTFCVLASIIPCSGRQVYTQQSLSSDHKNLFWISKKGQIFIWKLMIVT